MKLSYIESKILGKVCKWTSSNDLLVIFKGGIEQTATMEN